MDYPGEIAGKLDSIVGIVEHGLFLKTATGAIIASEQGIVERSS